MGAFTRIRLGTNTYGGYYRDMHLLTREHPFTRSPDAKLKYGPLGGRVDFKDFPSGIEETLKVLGVDNKSFVPNERGHNTQLRIMLSPDNARQLINYLTAINPTTQPALNLLSTLFRELEEEVQFPHSLQSPGRRLIFEPIFSNVWAEGKVGKPVHVRVIYTLAMDLQTEERVIEAVHCSSGKLILVSSNEIRDGKSARGQTIDWKAKCVIDSPTPTDRELPLG